MKRLKRVLADFWRRHIICDFPAYYHEKCFDCNAWNCNGCEYYK